MTIEEFKTQEMTEDERHFHRNGVSGLSFHVRRFEDALGVQFYKMEEKCIPLAAFEPLTKHRLVGRRGKSGVRNGATQFRAASTNGDYIICAYDSDKVTFIGVYFPECDDIAFATFQWDKTVAGNVRFFENSWRGDEMLWALEKQIGKPLAEVAV